jgi:hypothetical protein
MILFYIVLSVFIGYAIGSLIDMVFTFVFGKLLSYRFIQFVFYCFVIKRENGKLKFDIGNIQLGAECCMYKPNSTRKDVILYNVLPCVADIIVLLVLWYIFGMYEVHPILRYSSNIFGLYILLKCFSIQIIVKHCTSNEPSDIMWRKARDIINQLAAEVRPKDIEIDEVEIPSGKLGVYDIENLKYYYCLYYYYLDTFDYDKLRPIVELFEDNMPSTHASYYTGYIYEIIFYYAFIEYDIQKAQEYYSAIDTVLTSDKDVNGRRVLAYYLYYTNKGKDKALKVAKEGLAVADKFTYPGLAKLEKDLLERLIIEIGENN